MKTNFKKIIPRLLLIVLLVGVLAVLSSHPSLLDDLTFWWSGQEQPTEPEEPEAPVSPVEPEEPVVPSEPTEPTEPVVPSEPLAAIVSVSGAYYTYDQMCAQLLALQKRYPAWLSVETYGTSADGRLLYAATMGAPDAQRQVIVTAGMHAREYANVYLVMQQLEYYLQNYQTGRFGGVTYEDLFSQVAFVVIPMTNPDGVTLAQEGFSAIRSAALREQLESMLTPLVERGDKDAYLNREWKSNARGVDLNRNFDTRWAEYSSSKIYQHPTYKEYKGEMAGSEPETAALVTLTRSLTNPVASLCVHSQGNIIYWRCDQTGAFEVENKRLAQIAADITGYSIIDENQTEPSYSNWTVMELGIPTITIENGLKGYPQSYTMANGFFERNFNLWAAVAEEYGAP